MYIIKKGRLNFKVEIVHERYLVQQKLRKELLRKVYRDPLQRAPGIVVFLERVGRGDVGYSDLR